MRGKAERQQDRPVGFFLPNLEAGGTQQVQLLVAKGVASLGQRVDLVVAQAEGPFLERVPDGVRVIDLQSRSTIRTLPALSRYLKAEQPETLFAALNQANLLALLAKRASGSDTRLMMSVHTHFLEKWKHVNRISAPIRLSLFKWMYRQADGVICVSQGLRMCLVSELRIPAQHVSAIYNPVDSEHLQFLAKEPVDHPWLREEATIPVIVSVGRLDREKDFATLIRAFSVVAGQIPARLVIIGEGPRRKDLEKLVVKLGLNESVLLAGYQANPYAWMARSRLFTLSSLWEGFGMVLVEAAALGIPMVATDCPCGPAEIASLIKDISLVPVADPQALAARMLDNLQSNAPKLPTQDSLSAFDPLTCAKAYLAAAARPTGTV